MQKGNIRTYKGYAIKAEMQELQDGGWNINITISKEKEENNSVQVKQYSAENIFPNKQEAKTACWEFGRQIIDGEIEGKSLSV